MLVNLKNKIGGLILESCVYLDAIMYRSNFQQKQKILVFGQGRTGSTLLGTLLNSHSKIYFGDELLGSKRLIPKLYVVGRLVKEQKPVVGFHLKCYQITKNQNIENSIEFVDDFVNNGWKIIFLKRNDLFLHAISPLIAHEKNLWHIGRGNKVVDNKEQKVYLEPSRVLRAIQGREKFRELDQMILKKHDYLEIVYEEDLLCQENWVATQKKICAFLEVGEESLNSPLKKTTSKNIQDNLENYEEIHNYLKQNGYEFLFE